MNKWIYHEDSQRLDHPNGLHTDYVIFYDNGTWAVEWLNPPKYLRAKLDKIAKLKAGAK